jgi:hypothetical protein
VYENYLPAVNEHNIKRALLFYEENLENKYHNVVLTKGKDRLRESYEKRISHPDYLIQLLECLPFAADDRIRVHLKTSNDHNLFSKQNPERFIEAFGALINSLRYKDLKL